MDSGFDTFIDRPYPKPTIADEIGIREVEGGFPHSEILGSQLVRSSPRLIAAYHVLHRLSAPRHPPNALLSLDHSHDRCPSDPATRVTRPTCTIRKTLLQHARTAHAVTSALVQPRGVTPKARPGMPPSSRCQTPAPGRKPDANYSLSKDTRARNPMVEPDGIEPTTSCLQSTRSPN